MDNLWRHWLYILTKLKIDMPAVMQKHGIHITFYCKNIFCGIANKESVTDQSIHWEKKKIEMDIYFQLNNAYVYMNLFSIFFREENYKNSEKQGKVNTPKIPEAWPGFS